MKIAFELDQLILYPGNGISVYLYSLLRELAATGQPYRLAHASVRLREVRRALALCPGAERRILPFPGRWAGPIWGRYFLGGADVFHAVSGILPEWSSNWKGPLVATVHDLVPFRDREGNRTDASGEWYRAAFRRCAARADRIITVSEFTRRELCGLLDVDPARVEAIPIAAQFSAGEAAGAAALPPPPELAGKRYFLAVSTLSPRKNYETLLSAYDRFRADAPDTLLAVVGRPGWNCDALLKRLRGTAGVVHYENLPSSELPPLYGNCAGYFNLSAYEGFGIPLLEAMLCGARCCYAGGSAMDEIAGETGIRVEPYDTDAVVAAMARFASLPPVPEEQSAVRLRAERFSWARTARETCRVCREAAGR